MQRKTVRTLAAAFFAVFAAAVLWPGMVLFNMIEPFVLGLPFNLFWIALWVVLGMGMLFLLDRSENRFHQHEDRGER